MNRAKKQKLVEAVREQIEKRDTNPSENEWRELAVTFLRNYTGTHPILRSLARKAIRPDWIPTERQVIQVHRIAHRERQEVLYPQDSLGRRLRAREGPDMPSSLDEPTWL